MNDNNKDPQGSGPPELPEQPRSEPQLDPGHGAQHAPGVSGEQAQVIELVIRVQGNKLGVAGPIHDSIFCYGLLERAKDVIREQQNKPKRPPGVTPGGLHIPKAGFTPPQRR